MALANGELARHMRERRSQVKYLEKGKALYGVEEYAKAAVVLKQSISLCNCGASYRDKPCVCKDVIQAIKEDALEAEVAKRCICSANATKPCRVSAHLDALDALAAVHEHLKQLDLAQSMAIQMIILLPPHAKGYLRLAKVLRLQGRQTFHQKLASWTCKAGTQLIGKADSTHSLLPKLLEYERRIRRASKYDPFEMFPVELLVMVFKNLDLPSRCCSTGVSKKWRAFLTARDEYAIRELWRVQRYPHGIKRILHPEAFKKMCSWAGNSVTELVIGGCYKWHPNAFNPLTIFKLCPGLKILKLQGHSNTMFDAPRMDYNDIPFLTELWLGRHVQYCLRFLEMVLKRSSNSLKKLSVFKLPSDYPITQRLPDGSAAIMRWFPHLDNLETLRLGKDPDQQSSIEMGLIMQRTPNLQTVWIDEFMVRSNHPQPSETWPKLENIYFGSSLFRLWPYQPTFLSSKMREIHLNGRGPEEVFHVFYELNKSKKPTLDKLQKLTLRAEGDYFSQEFFEFWIRPSFESGSLTELDIRPFFFCAGMARLWQADWFKSDSLTFLGIEGFSTAFGLADIHKDETLQLITDRFPNLECLDIGNSDIKDSTLGQLIKRGVKTVYYRHSVKNYDAPDRIELRDWAKTEHGAGVINGIYPNAAGNLPYLPLC